jgi:aromatic-L-amino-acid/L-tryptophan decarboxylase
MVDMRHSLKNEITLDPADWNSMRQLGHQMIDDMMDYLQHIGEQPVWKAIPHEAKEFLQTGIPLQPQSIESVYEEFKQFILPYTKGNIHPRFWAWVQGTGTPFGMLAEMLAAGMNPNSGIGEHSAMYVEQQVLNWCKQMLHYPSIASGILVSGASIANITALAVARNHQLNKNVRKEGIRAVPAQMLLYCSAETHSCIQKAAEALGLGSDSVRKISVTENYEINITELEETIQQDIKNGLAPFCIVGNAGTVNTGAIDPLDDLLELCRKYSLWFHIDGAFGAIAKLVPEYAVSLKAIEAADSIAFDLHKWMYMPYEVGCVLIKNAEAHRNSFALSPTYLLTHERGLAAGPDPFNNYGMELSRGFKALKVWMSLKEHGLEKYKILTQQNIAQAFYLEELVKKQPQLEMLCPVTMNIVCFRFYKEGFTTAQLNELNKEIVMQLQETGIVSPSSTLLKGNYAIRLAIVNHRSRKEDFEKLVEETVKLGNKIAG